MAPPIKIEKAALIALKDYLGLTAEETLLVIADENTREIGMLLYETGKKISYEAFYLEMLARDHNGEEPPEQVADMMKMVDVVVCPTTTSLSHTAARRRASESGVRIATMPGIDEEILKRCLSADFKKVISLTEAVYTKMQKLTKIRVISKAGTDITMVVKNRRVTASTGVIRNIGESGNLPSGEVYLAPQETKSNGTIVFDGSISGIGMLNSNVHIEIKNGFARKIRGEDEADQLKSMLQKAGKDSFVLSEFGIGTNYKAKLTGNILEDEKVLGTIHLAFGNNLSSGGKINVQSHIDGIVKMPTVYLDNEMIMDNGKLLIE